MPVVSSQIHLGSAAAPVARIVPRERAFHGETLVDPYGWLRDRTDPAVIAYLEAENAFTDAAMKPLEPLQEALYQEILGRMQQTDLDVPVRDGEFVYYERTEEGKQYPLYCRKPVGDNAPSRSSSTPTSWREDMHT